VKVDLNFIDSNLVFRHLLYVLNYEFLTDLIAYFLDKIKITWYIHKLITRLIIVVLIQMLILLDQLIFLTLIRRLVLVARPETVLAKTVQIVCWLLIPAGT
jgi:hypothetical protein